MRARHHRDGAHGRAADPSQRRDFAGLVGAQLERDRPVLGGEPEQGQGQPPLVVEARLGLEHRAQGAEHGRHHLLGRGLAVGAGHGRDGQREPGSVVRGEAAERPRGVIHEHGRHRGRKIVGQRVNDNAGGAAGGRVSEIGVAIELAPSDGEEDLADGEGAAVDGHAPHRHAEIPPDQGALGPADDVFDGERGYHLDFPP